MQLLYIALTWFLLKISSGEQEPFANSALTLFSVEICSNEHYSSDIHLLFI